MKPWMIGLVIAVLMSILGSWLRDKKEKALKPLPRPRKVARDDDAPPWEEAAPKPRRRVPPPLPVKRGRRAEVVPTALPAAQVITPLIPAQPDAPLLHKVEAPAPSAVAVQLAAFLKHPKTLRAAILLGQVLGPPKCRQLMRGADQPKQHER